jgi:hypothetical protein
MNKQKYPAIRNLSVHEEVTQKKTALLTTEIYAGAKAR